MTLQFLNTQAFWAMLAIPPLLGALVWGIYRREAALREFGRADLLMQFSRFSFDRKTALRVLPPILGFALVVTVAARPQWIGPSGRIRKGTLDVLAILDVSKSMAAEDCGPETSRIELAKNTLLSCLPKLAGNRLGIVTFAGKSFPQAELTDDFQALKFVIQNWIRVDSAPSQGSNIGMALSEATGLFEENDRKRVVLLFSDGGHRRPDDLGGILADMVGKGIPVVSVGIGTKEGSRIPVYEKGRFKGWFKLEGREVVTRLNEDTLREIAEATGGRYVHLASGRELDGIFQDSRILGKAVSLGGREVFQIPLGMAIGLFFLTLYSERRGI